ncbi:MAG TPA: CaiB/BaiF CoA-transferase family protein, partial [Usitatibacter sp.]
MPHIPASKALARFRVVDMTQVRAGPTAARQLADWGADVIQVQMPEHMRGDDTLGGQEGSDYQYTHRNKRSITLNLKEPAGIDALKKLVATADVLLENFRPDVKTRLGIDYDALSKVNPRLVYASISGFGQTGPYATRPGFDQIAQGMGGLMSVTGLPGQGPLRVGLPIADLCAGIFAAYGVTVALLERDVSGKGQWLHTSLLEAQIYMMDFQT